MPVMHYDCNGAQLTAGSKVTYRDMDCTIAILEDDMCILSDEATGVIYIIPASERSGGGPLHVFGVG